MSRRIASDTAAITQMFSGDHGRNAALALTRILALSNALTAQVEQNSQVLEDVRTHSSCIKVAFAGLANTVAIFRNLCTLTRIETSRLGDTGGDFGDLAAETKSLSESMKAGGEGVLEAASRLDESIQAARQRGSELRARELNELPALVAAVNDCLRAFEERCQHGLATSSRQAAEYASITGEIDDVVRVVQFHDITRQQIEHVVQALRQLSGEWASGAWGTRPLSPQACAILTLQSSQLAGASELFASSIERTSRDLEGIAGRVQNMAAASQALMGVSGNEQDSFFLTMEGHFTAILRMLRACTATQAEMASRVPDLEETRRGMLDSVAEIRSIEIRIQRIAINAVIRALHLRDAGSGLNVIAEMMGSLALDSNRNTEEAAAAIGLMERALQHFSGPADIPDAASSRPEGVIAEMQRTILDLHTLGESSFSQVSHIAESGGLLVGEVNALRGGFTAGPLFARVVGRARAELDRIAALAGAQTLAAVEPSSLNQLDSLAQRYTMQVERDVHDSVARGAAIDAATAGLAEVTLKGGDFGDNVELF